MRKWTMSRITESAKQFRHAVDWIYEEFHFLRRRVVRGQNTDNTRHSTVDRQRLAQYRAISAKVPLPKSVRYQHHARCAFFIVCIGKISSQRGLHTEHIEVIRADDH